MFSPTDSQTRRVRRAQSRAGAATLLGGAALGLALGLAGLFVWQAGVLTPPTPQAASATAPVEKPDKITAENASISGRDKNNLSYEISAASGEQDKDNEHVVHMQQVTSLFGRTSGGKIKVSSAAGQYDRKSKELLLTGDVVINEGTRYLARMNKAAINTDDKTLTSQSPVKVDMQGSLIEAGSLTVSGNGSHILFKGGVKARFKTKTTQSGDGG